MKTVLLSQIIHPRAMAMLEGRRILLPKTPDQAAFDALLPEADALIMRSNLRLSAEALDTAKNLRMIARFGVGLDNLPLEKIKERRIVLTSAPNANSISVAEHTVAMLLALAKYLPQLDRGVRTGGWDMRLLDLPIELYGKTVGIVGMGRIGRLTADILHNGFKMRVLAYGPHIAAKEFPAYTVAPDLETVFRESDFICLHCPSTDATRGMIGASLFGIAKQGMLFINCARGDIVVEADLVDALERGIIAGAALDVFDEEPLSEKNPLRAFPNVVFTPHAAALTREASIRMATTAAEQVNAYFETGVPEFVVKL